MRCFEIEFFGNFSTVTFCFSFCLCLFCCFLLLKEIVWVAYSSIIHSIVYTHCVFTQSKVRKGKNNIKFQSSSKYIFDIVDRLSSFLRPFQHFIYFISIGRQRRRRRQHQCVKSAIASGQTY